jgi:hypothetical protein
MPRVAPRALLALAVVLTVPVHARATGNVTVTVSDGVLSVSGDDAPNSLVITGTGADGVFLLAGALDTTVNGAGSLEVSGVRRLSLKPGGGSDDVQLLQATVDGPVTVRLGDGDDTFTVDQSRLDGRLNVRGENGSDVVVVQGRTRVQGRIVVRTGRGTDTIRIEDVDPDTNVTLSGGSGDDLVDVEDVRGGATSRLRIDTGDGEDRVQIASGDFHDDVLVFLDDDDDVLVVEDSFFERDAEFDGGNGDDVLSLQGFVDFDFSEDVVFEDF